MSISVHLSLSVSVSLYLFLCLLFLCLLYLSLCLYVSMPLYFSLSLCLCISVSLYLSLCLCPFLSAHHSKPREEFLYPGKWKPMRCYLIIPLYDVLGRRPLQDRLLLGIYVALQPPSGIYVALVLRSYDRCQPRAMFRPSLIRSILAIDRSAVRRGVCRVQRALGDAGGTLGDGVDRSPMMMVGSWFSDG